MTVRLLMRRLLRTQGYDFHSLPVERLGLRDLHFDLPELVTAPSPLVFDVGANKGQTIELMKASFPFGRIVAFEPNPDLHPKLREKYGPSGVLVEGVVVGNSCGEVEFIIVENDELSSVLQPDRHSGNPFSSVPIRRIVTAPIITLDAYCAGHAVARIDLLKVDTQGFDLEVLRGAGRLLSEQRIDVVLVEVNFIGLYHGQCHFGDIERFLAGTGYGLVGLYEVVRGRGCVSWATACFRMMGQSNA